MALKSSREAPVRPASEFKYESCAPRYSSSPIMPRECLRFAASMFCEAAANSVQAASYACFLAATSVYSRSISIATFCCAEETLRSFIFRPAEPDAPELLSSYKSVLAEIAAFLSSSRFMAASRLRSGSPMGANST